MFVGMWIWTSVAPLQIAIGNTTSITDQQLRTASTCSVLGELHNVLSSISHVTMMYLFNASITPGLSFTSIIICIKFITLHIINREYVRSTCRRVVIR